MNFTKLDWSGWFYRIMYGFIGGGASALTTYIGLSGAKMAGMDIPTLNWKTWGIIFLSSGVSGALLYLKQSPLPPEDGEQNKG